MAEARNYEEYRRQVLDELGIEYVTEDITDFRKWKKMLLNSLADLITKGDMTEPVAKWLDAHPEAITMAYVTPEMFGAKGDGVTDDTEPIQTAFDSGEMVLFSQKTYLITGRIKVSSNTIIEGNSATLKIKDNTLLMFDGSDLSSENIEGILCGYGVSNIYCHNLTFDMNGQNMPIFSDYSKLSNIGFAFSDCVNIAVEDCKFINIYNCSIIIHNTGGHISVIKNYFESFVQHQGLRCEHICIHGIPSEAVVSIEKNIIKNALCERQYGVCGIYMYNSDAITNIKNNVLINCGRDNNYHHRLLPIDFYRNVNNAIIENNVIISIFGYIRLEGSHDILLKNNIFNNISDASDLEPAIWLIPAINNNIHDIKIIGNKFITKVAQNGYGILLNHSYLETIDPIENVLIENNSFVGDCNWIVFDECQKDLTIKSNKFKSGNVGPIQILTRSAGLINAKSENVYIVSNTFETLNKAVDIGVPTIDNFVFNDNVITEVNFNNGIQLSSAGNSIISGNTFNHCDIYCHNANIKSYCTNNLFNNLDDNEPIVVESGTVVKTNNYKDYILISN